MPPTIASTAIRKASSSTATTTTIAFCRWKLLEYCDHHDVGHVVGLARNEVLKRAALPFTALAHSRFVNTGKKQRHFYGLRYAAKTWDRERRVIVKAEHLPKGANTRFVVTNLENVPKQIYDGIYTHRGEMENRIKEPHWVCLPIERVVTSSSQTSSV